MRRQSRNIAALVLASTVSAMAMAQSEPSGQRSIGDWLNRVHQAAVGRAYTGTLIVSAGSAMSTSKVWHVCDGNDQMEKVETLSGAPRTTIRHNSEVITFDPGTGKAFREKRESLGLFPELMKVPNGSLERFYLLERQGEDRVAGHMADVLTLLPRDDLRFGYKIWAEQSTGLVVKLQTLGEGRGVLEQVVFTELNLNAPVEHATLAAQMVATSGFQVFEPKLAKTTAEEQGWRLSHPVPGFVPMGCHVRADEAGNAVSGAPMQWVFSDGLASVSLFVEQFDPAKHQREGAAVMGATHSLSRRLGEFWLTVLGEVPPLTLARFAQSLERLP
ncbi:MucB/RseB C-terminal domain-containing protein [Hydrogenophaga sp. 5NK40-0174]|uniref:MucB/RseB C-terminal domain-containing protein n=1 Tax=Hydrogenophaga sp. 5NK40-0174 TaxID=3127649 RepID=UPI00333E7F4C